MRQALVWSASCCISIPFCCNAAALSSMELFLRLMPLDATATTSSITRENLKTMNFELERERLRISY